uniref:Uncharacterized protein n=1 Tax=Glossina pallidipes TaxID=7398 RepID=A0A1B0AEE0_GLOPL
MYNHININQGKLYLNTRQTHTKICLTRLIKMLSTKSNNICIFLRRERFDHSRLRGRDISDGGSITTSLIDMTSLPSFQLRLLQVYSCGVLLGSNLFLKMEYTNFFTITINIDKKRTYYRCFAIVIVWLPQQLDFLITIIVFSDNEFAND